MISQGQKLDQGVATKLLAVLLYFSMGDLPTWLQVACEGSVFCVNKYGVITEFSAIRTRSNSKTWRVPQINRCVVDTILTVTEFVSVNGPGSDSSIVNFVLVGVTNGSGHDWDQREVILFRKIHKMIIISFTLWCLDPGSRLEPQMLQMWNACFAGWAARFSWITMYGSCIKSPAKRLYVYASAFDDQLI